MKTPCETPAPSEIPIFPWWNRNPPSLPPKNATEALQNGQCSQAGEPSGGRADGEGLLELLVERCFGWVSLVSIVKLCDSLPEGMEHTSSTAQGGGGSFKNRKPIGEVGCCESGMAERSHWLTERWLELCLLEWLQWLQWSPHPQLLDVVSCTATVVVVVA